MNIYIKNLAIGLFLTILVLPVIASAAVVVRTGESIDVAADQSVPDDFYAAAGKIIISGSVGGDVAAVGGNVTVNGPVGADLFILSGAAYVHASVTEDVRIISGDVVIAEPVGGDVFVIGGEVSILSSASVGGDVFVLGGSATIDAPVTGSVMGTAERLRINSSIGGDVDVKIGRDLILGEKAAVAGNVRYESTFELVRSQGAVIEGEVVKNTAPVSESSRGTFAGLLTPFLVLLFGALVLFLFFRPRLESWAPQVLIEYGRNGLVGLGVLLVAPVVTLILLVSVLGLLVGVVALFFLGVLYVSALLLLPVTAGAIISRVYQPTFTVSLISIVLGAAVLIGLLMIPVIGPLIIFVLYVITLGALAMSGYQLIRF